MQGVFAIWQLQGSDQEALSATTSFRSRMRSGARSIRHAGTGTYVSVSVLEKERVSHGQSYLSQREETLGGYIVHGMPFPVSTDEEALAFLKKMAPIQIEQEYKITYLHSYGQDSPWFAGLTNKRLLASATRRADTPTPTRAATICTPARRPSGSTSPTVPAKVHAFTVCYFGSEEFLPETPFVLALIEFEGVNTLLLTRLMGVDPAAPSLDWIGMEVKPRFLRNSQAEADRRVLHPGQGLKSRHPRPHDDGLDERAPEPAPGRHPAAPDDVDLGGAGGRHGALLTVGGGEFVPAWGWLAAAVLMALFAQPALLALTAVQWALSMVAWIPGVARISGADALTTLLQPGGVRIHPGWPSCASCWRSPPGTSSSSTACCTAPDRRRGSIRTCRPSRRSSPIARIPGHWPGVCSARRRSWQRWSRWR